MACGDHNTELEYDEEDGDRKSAALLRPSYLMSTQCPSTYIPKTTSARVFYSENRNSILLRVLAPSIPCIPRVLYEWLPQNTKCMPYRIYGVLFLCSRKTMPALRAIAYNDTGVVCQLDTAAVYHGAFLNCAATNWTLYKLLVVAALVTAY